MSDVFSDEEQHQTEAEWLAVRRSALGASDAPAVMGVSPYRTPLQLFADKLGLLEAAPRSEAQQWGLLLEAPMAKKYEEETGHRLRDPGRYTLRRSREIPWMVATLDREIVEAPGHDVPAVLELKHRAWANPAEWDEEPPVDILVQVQHQLAVTGWAWAAVGALLGGTQFRRFVVPRHDAFIARLINAEAVFMARLKAKAPPPVDGAAATRDVLRALYPVESPGLVVDLPEAALQWDAERVQAITDGKVAEARKQLAENRLIAALGDAEMGVLPNGTTYTYRAHERKGYTVSPSVVRALHRKEPTP